MVSTRTIRARRPRANCGWRLQRGQAARLLGKTADTQVFLGALLELLLIVANIGTGIVLFRT